MNIHRTASRFSIGSIIVALVGLCVANAQPARVSYAGPDVPHGVWTTSGDLNIGRADATAVLLRNNTVLVAGGMAAGWASLDSAEIYDPATGKWTATAPLHFARYDHTATVLQDGRVLIAGGFSDGVALNSAEIYDPVAGTWAVTGNLKEARWQHAATLLPSGKVLVAGGIGNGQVLYSHIALASSEIYDPATGQWSAAGNLNGVRSGPAAVRMPDGKVFVVGGGGDFDGSTYPSITTTEQFDPATGAWTITGQLRGLTHGMDALLLPNGNVLVVSTSGSAQYIPSMHTWSPVAPMKTYRGCYQPVLLPNGMVLAAGGCVNAGFGSTTLTELFDPITNTWTQTADLSVARMSHSAVALPGGQVLVTGSWVPSHGTVSSSTELYDSTADHPHVMPFKTYFAFLPF